MPFIALEVGLDGYGRNYHIRCRIWLLSILVGGYAMMPINLWGQTGSTVSYEGQKVAFIELVGRPGVAMDTLRPLITQSVGEPYSNEKIRASMAALYRTGRFSDVQVDVQPEPAGLRVTFILQPAFYIGMIEFPGATAQFAYPRLLQIVNIPSQELYAERRVAEAETALLHFLETQGYFAATVQTDTRFDEANQLVHLDFHTTLNQQAKIRRVNITGPPDSEVESLRSALRLKPGQRYKSERLDAAKRRAQNYFRKKDQLVRQIQMAPAHFDSETDQVDLSVKVTVGPMVDVKTVGAKVSKKTLRDLIPIYEENTFDTDLVEEGERNLENHFQTKGYFDADVQSSVDEKAAKLTVVYQVDLGKRRKVADIELEGNVHFTDEYLLERLRIRQGGWFSRGAFNAALLRESINNLTALYHNAGFEEVRVESQVDSRDSGIFITLRITEGPQTRVNSLRVEGNRAKPIAELVPGGLNLQPNRPYSEQLLAQDRDRILAAYLDLGYLNARFESRVDRLSEDPHQMTVVYIIHEGQQAHMGDVLVLGAEQTNETFLRARAGISEGNPLSQGKMLEAESRLYNLGIFDWVNIGPRRPITSQEQEKVLLKAHEVRREMGNGASRGSRTCR